MRVLENLITDRQQASLWRRIRRVMEGDPMETLFTAYRELVEDTTVLLDPGDAGYANSAVMVQLERDDFGRMSIEVHLKEISGAQLAFVLDVARRHELDARSVMTGWLTLEPHLTGDDLDAAELEPQAVEA